MLTTFFNLFDRSSFFLKNKQVWYIHLSKPNTNWGKQRLLYHACKEYNDLDNNIKSIKELDSFYNALLKSPKY